MAGIGGGLGFDGPPLGLGTEQAGVVTSDAFLRAEQALIEWAAQHGKLFAEHQLVEWQSNEAMLTGEQAVVEWSNETALLTAEQLIVEWAPPPPALISNEQAVVEWASDAGVLDTEHLLTEWVPGDAGIITAEELLVEWGTIVTGSATSTATASSSADALTIAFGDGFDQVGGFSSAAGSVVAATRVPDHLPIGYGGPVVTAKEFFGKLLDRYKPKPALPRDPVLPGPIRGRAWQTVTGRTRAVATTRAHPVGVGVIVAGHAVRSSVRWQGSGRALAGAGCAAALSVRASSLAGAIATVLGGAGARSRALARAASRIGLAGTARLTRNERDELALLFADDPDLSLVFDEES